MSVLTKTATTMTVAIAVAATVPASAPILLPIADVAAEAALDAALDADDRESHLGAFNIGRPNLERRAVGDGADGIEDNLLALLGLDLFNLDRIAGLDKHLLAAGFEYCVGFHCVIPFPFP